MIFTLFYMYSTFVQWWRLGVLTNKINGTLNGKNALMICSGNCVSEPKFRRCLENLLFQKADRMGCIVVPRQKVNLQHWLTFPQDMIYFPIHFGRGRPNLASAKVFVLVQALLEKYAAHDADIVEIESFGEPIAWRVNSNFEIILRTDLEHVTKLVHCFSNGDIDINHDLRLLRVETVDVEGTPCSIKYENAFPVEQKLKYSCGEIHWRKFVASVKELYGKIYELSSRPKITIEKDRKIEVPVSEVKPIKKETKKDLETEEEKNTLAVRSRKSDHRVKAEKQHRGSGDRMREVKSKSKDHHFHRVKEESKRSPKINDDGLKTKDKRTKKEVSAVTSDDIDGCYARAVQTSPSEIFARARDNGDIFEDCCSLSPSRNTGSQSTDTATLTDLFLDASGSGTVSLSKSADSEFYFSYDDETSLRDDMALPRQSVARTNLRNDLTAGSPRRKGEAAAVPSCLLNRKPPNVLVYADSPVAKENVKEVLHFVLNKEKYTIYDLPVSKAAANFWDESTTLVVVCGNVTPTLTSELLQYLLTGGRLLCLCSDLLYSVLQTFSTAEVREHELVRFSYGDWKSIRMMHHIFCYQASPAKKQFSKDSDQSGHSPVAPRTPSAVEIQHDGKSYVIQVQVLGTEETWQTPSLLLASVKDSEGTAIFSQVHLEIDPTQYQDDESKYAALTDSNRARLEILKHILSNHLDMDCTNKSEPVVAYSYGYFLGRHDAKLKMLAECESIANNKLENDKVSLIFCGKDVAPGDATSTRLPVLILSCPSNFSTVLYFETLQTQEIGRLVIYTDVLTSSQFILSRKLTHGLVVIPRQQTQGFGRSNNTWLSPEGCAMFSLQLHVPMKSTLGKSLSLTQHLVMTAVVSAVRSLPGYEKVELGLKWPNDLYAYSKIKVGGLVVTSQVFTDVAVVNVGCGINLDNFNPTTCINDVVRKHDAGLQEISYEKFFAIVFNEVERILGIVQSGDVEFLFDLYYKYWLHSGSEISVMTKEGRARRVKIVGIDEFGFLTVQTSDGRLSGVQPDGNTFDMMRGLIAPKIN